MRFLAIPVLFVALLTATASAHPLTDIRYDRTAAVRLSPAGIDVRYTLELSTLAMHLDAAQRFSPAEIAALDRTTEGFAKAYARKFAGELGEKFRITIDGTPVQLKVTPLEVTVTDHAQCRYLLTCDWPPGKSEREISVHDITLMGKPGLINLTLDLKGVPKNTVELLSTVEPTPRMRTTLQSQLSEQEAELSRRASAEIKLPFGEAVKPPQPPANQTDTTPSLASTEPAFNTEVVPAPNLFVDLANRGLPALFDSKLGTGILLLAAFLFGAAHAFTPGHGKTLVAAYLIGERGTVGHAVLLAFVTTVTHTGSVIGVAAILWFVYGNEVPGRTQGVLQLIAGFLVMGVGLWLLLRRLAGRADHFHLFSGHHHHHHHGDGSGHTHTHDGHTHSHDHAHHHQHGPAPESAKTTAGWFRIVLMGMGGGIVPCWDAVLLLVAAAAMNRVGFAVPLLLAFSAGLGAVLVILGIGVVYAYKTGEKRFREHRWFQVLPMISAVLLVGIGIWLCKQAVHMTTQ
jgi:nickel/cobalt exporter